MAEHYKGLPEDAEADYLKAIRESIEAGLPETGPAVTGIALRLADLYEKLERYEDALEIFGRVFGIFGGREHTAPIESREDAERMRKVVGIALRVGDVYKQKGDLKAAEKFYEWSTKTILGLRSPPPLIHHSVPTSSSTAHDWASPASLITDEDLTRKGLAPTHTQPSSEFAPASPPTAAKGLQPAPWATISDLGGSLEQLAGLYADMGRIDLALALYSHALNLLTRDDSLAPPARSCRAAILSNNMAECFVQLGGTHLVQAERWGRKALEDAERAIELGGVEECGECATVVEYNLGCIDELQKKYRSAISHFVKSREHAASVKYIDGVRMGREALARVRRAMTEAKQQTQDQRDAS
ncbi:hypothetical protein HK104_010839 [Borealophlyctis nickersoniae]|nr:hypothetical protein HK104_010839 [Borealophlyctis nickersoniae]